MNDAVYIAAIGAINTIALGYFAMQQVKYRSEQQEIKSDVAKIEKHTNSMQEKMMASATKDGHDAGVIAGLAQANEHNKS